MSGSAAEERANVSLRLDGNVTSFDSERFLMALSVSVNITRERLSIYSIRSGR